MTHHIYDRVVVPLVWNDQENAWEVDTTEMGTGPLPYADGPDERACDHGDHGLDQECDETWGRAGGVGMPTAEQLTQMLGFAMVRATAPANADVQHRPASPGLVDMLDGAIKSTLAEPHLLADSNVRAIIRALLPIISSVDENAHRRGMFEQRMAGLEQPDREALRAVINDAYYDTRNSDGTMDQAAALAADKVIALLGGQS